MWPLNSLTMLRDAFLIFYFVAGSQQVSITKFDVPHEVEAGKSAELRCVYEIHPEDKIQMMFVKWWWTPLNEGPDKKIQLYQRNTEDNNHQLMHQNVISSELESNTSNTDTLVLPQLEPKHSGTFQCCIEGKFDVIREQELIVYTAGSGPQLNISVAPDGPDEDSEEDVLVTCAASGVAPRPDLNISVADFLLGASQEVSDLVDGLYDIVANATISKARADGSEFRCELLFNNITHPAYIDSETYRDPSTTELPVAPARTGLDNATAVTTDPTSGVSAVSSLWTSIILVSLHIITNP